MKVCLMPEDEFEDFEKEPVLLGSDVDIDDDVDGGRTVMLMTFSALSYALVFTRFAP